jgi:aldehyde:ferredoxin oxidoreductase
MDCISTGNVIAFAMELMEKGIISEQDTGGIDLTWGNGKAALQMVKMIAEKEGFGAVLGTGIKKIVERLGGLSSEYAMHVKGLDFAAHDPRSTFSLALHYATCNLGASHYAEGGCLVYALDDYEKGFYTLNAIPELWYNEKVSRYEEKGKGEYVGKLQDYGTLMDSLALCSNVHRGRVQPSQYAKLLNLATGWDVDKDEFLLIGERTFNMKRMINVRRGISRKDDFLPLRFLTTSRGEGESADSIPNLGPMLKEYYAYRDWSEEGIPTKKKLVELGLEECLDYAIS